MRKSEVATAEDSYRSEKGDEGIWPGLSTTVMNVRIETNNFHGTTLSSTDDV